MFLLGLRALFSWLQTQGQRQSFGVRRPNADPLFNKTMSGQFLSICSFCSSWLQHEMTSSSSWFHKIIYVSLLWFLEVKFQVLREDSPASFQAEYYHSTSENYRFLSFPSVQVMLLIRDTYDSGSWGVEGFVLCFPPILHMLHLLICRYTYCCHYDITLPQTMFRLLPLLLYHLLSLATLPIHTVVFYSSFSQ